MHAKVANALTGISAPFHVHRHASFGKPITSPQDFAEAVGYPLHRITKTLFVRCRGADTRAMVVCPMGRRVDFAAVAAALGCKKVEVAPLEELRDKIGYPPNGVSPFGLNGTAVLMDEGLLEQPTILVGAGEEGVEIEISPQDLRGLTGASVLKLAL